VVLFQLLKPHLSSLLTGAFQPLLQPLSQLVYLASTLQFQKILQLHHLASVLQGCFCRYFILLPLNMCRKNGTCCTSCFCKLHNTKVAVPEERFHCCQYKFELYLKLGISLLPPVGIALLTQCFTLLKTITSQLTATERISENQSRQISGVVTDTCTFLVFFLEAFFMPLNQMNFHAASPARCWLCSLYSRWLCRLAEVNIFINASTMKPENNSLNSNG
jgi:hypothetical protein